MPPLPANIYELVFNLGAPTVVLLFVLYWLGRRMDKLNDSILANTLATNHLVALVDSHIPSRRERPPNGG